MSVNFNQITEVKDGKVLYFACLESLLTRTFKFLLRESRDKFTNDDIKNMFNYVLDIAINKYPKWFAEYNDKYTYDYEEKVCFPEPLEDDIEDYKNYIKSEFVSNFHTMYTSYRYVHKPNESDDSKKHIVCAYSDIVEALNKKAMVATSADAEKYHLTKVAMTLDITNKENKFVNEIKPFIMSL